MKVVISPGTEFNPFAKEVILFLLPPPAPFMTLLIILLTSFLFVDLLPNSFIALIILSFFSCLVYCFNDSKSMMFLLNSLLAYSDLEIYICRR